MKKLVKYPPLTSTGQIMAIPNVAAIILIIKDINPLRLALTDPPIVAIKVVIQVPIVAPKTIYMALEKGIAPVDTITIAIPVTALEDCTNAVNTIPINKRRIGKLISVNNC